VLPIVPQWWGDDKWQSIVLEPDKDDSEGKEALLVSDTTYNLASL
jgi:hypothetical protein